ncbi:MAG: (2Fe-2S)-binding protein, partial [Acidobacteriota bacterium]|nr:(2Fe-2S)-binding protein [Acidobacteriota bacterium]
MPVRVRGNDAVVNVEAVEEAVRDAVVAVPQPVRDVLDGVWLGAPLHPALTDVPIGAWTAAAALDAVGHEAADEALAVGVLAALPAALTGLNDWSHLKGETRQVGIVHALVNSG